MGIESYSTTAASNNSSPPNGWPENMAPSAVNNSARQMMADIRTWYEDAQWINYGDSFSYASTTSVSVATDLTARYPEGRRIKAVGTSTGTIFGTIASSSYSAPNTTVTATWDSGGLASESLTISAGIVVPASSGVDIAGLGGLAAFFGAGLDYDSTTKTVTSGYVSKASGGGATYEFDSSSIVTGYDYLFIGRNLIPATDAVQLWVRTSTDGGSTFDSATNSYNMASFVIRSGGTASEVFGGLGTKFVFCADDVENTAGFGGVNFMLHLVNPLSASYQVNMYGYGSLYNSSGQNAMFMATGVRATTADVDGVQFLFESGNITSGTIECWRRATQ